MQDSRRSKRSAACETALLSYVVTDRDTQFRDANLAAGAWPADAPLKPIRRAAAVPEATIICRNESSVCARRRSATNPQFTPAWYDPSDIPPLVASATRASL